MEFDEDQHNTARYRADEAARTEEIWRAPGRLPLPMLRFNPDSYINAGGCV